MSSRKKKATFPYPYEYNGRHGTIYELGDGNFKAYFTYAHKQVHKIRSTFEKAKAFLREEFETLDTNIAESQSQHPLSRDRKYYFELEQLLKTEADGSTLRDAVDFYMANRRKSGFKAMTAVDCASRFLQHKKENNTSQGHNETLTKHFKRFCEDFGSRKIHEIEASEIHDWLHSRTDPKTKRKWSVRTRTSNLGSLVSLSLFARDFLKAIPESLGKTEFQRVQRPKPAEREEVEIYTPDELKKLLDTAVSEDPDIIPIIVLGAIQGLRPAEAHGEGVDRKKLQWSAFDWNKKLLHVRGQKVRSKKTRSIPIQPATEKWLAPFMSLKGDIWKYTEANTKKLIALREKAGVRSIFDGFRHSYASYRINQLEQKLPKLAQEMGNSPQEIIDSYKKNVTEEETEAWFSVLPSDDYFDMIKAHLGSQA